MTNKICTALLLSLLLSANAFGKARDFGNGADMSKLQAISTVLASPAEFMNQEITVEGTITAVCQKRGCWMKLASDKKFQSLKIKVKDGDMVFPMSAKGKTAYATGRLQAMPMDKQQTIKYLSHLAKEAKESFDPNSVKEGMTLYQLVPTGVTIAQ